MTVQEDTIRLAARSPGNTSAVSIPHEGGPTTDVRRGKLRRYEARGFPEAWMEVPEGCSASRPAGLRSGLTVHLPGGGAYRESPGSRAFPGWRAEDVHTATNEASTAAATGQVPGRVARAFGGRDGAGPDDDPMPRSLRGQSRAEGRMVGEATGEMEGLAKGGGEGRTEGRAATLTEMAYRSPRPRAAEVSEGFPADPVCAASSVDAVFGAAACKDEAGFPAALRPPRVPRVPGGAGDGGGGGGTNRWPARRLPCGLPTRMSYRASSGRASRRRGGRPRGLENTDGAGGGLPTGMARQAARGGTA